MARLRLSANQTDPVGVGLPQGPTRSKAVGDAGEPDVLNESGIVMRSVDTIRVAAGVVAMDCCVDSGGQDVSMDAVLETGSNGDSVTGPTEACVGVGKEVVGRYAFPARAEGD